MSEAYHVGHVRYTLERPARRNAAGVIVSPALRRATDTRTGRFILAETVTGTLRDQIPPERDAT